MNDEGTVQEAGDSGARGARSQETAKDERNAEREERTNEALSVLELAGKSGELARVTCVQERLCEGQLRGYFYGDGVRKDSISGRINKGSDSYFSPRSTLEVLERDVIDPLTATRSPNQQLWSEVEAQANGDLSRENLGNRGNFIRSHGVEDAQGMTVVGEAAQQLRGLNSVTEELASRVNGDRAQHRSGLYRDSLVEIEAVEGRLAASISDTEFDNKNHPSLTAMRETLTVVKEFHAYMESWLADYQQRVLGLAKGLDGNTDTAGRVVRNLEAGYEESHK
ncbi:MAG: hypothetical protein M1352_03205 [Patescibacteria group bacterium]|nr:hypothetical protein [Patescibacteria group bacterium]